MREKNPCLRLDERFTHLVTAEESVVLVGDDDSILLESAVAADVLRLLDGQRTAVQIAQSLEDHHRPEIVHFALLTLERGEVIREVQDRTDTQPEAADAEFENPSADALIAERLRLAWEERGAPDAVRVTLPGSERPAVELILTDDYLHSELAHCTHATEPRLLACLGRRRVWLGPRIQPGRTACVSCLQERLRLNLAARSLLHIEGEAGAEGIRIERIARDVPPTAYRALALALLETKEDSCPSALVDRLRVLPLDGGSAETHVVSRLPQCPECGDPTLAPPGADIELASRLKVDASGGGYRVVRPEETLRRFVPLISPLTGVIRRLQEVPVEGTDLVHVYTASHARHYGVATLRSLRGDRRDPSGGKGITDLDARVSAVCESLERFSSVHRGREPCSVARYSEVGAEAVHPSELLLFSPEQFRTRDEWNSNEAGGFQWVPEPYEDEPIEWSPARSLSTGSMQLVPSSCVYFGFKGEGRRFCKGDSNGLAGGNCLEEAILQGFLELVERDAVALWWYNRARVPGLDLASSRDPTIEAITAFYATLQRSIWALDLTTDLGIPCFAALSAKENAQEEDIIFGFGAHLDADIALSRAISEVNQMLPTILRTQEERRRQLLPDFEDAIQWWDSATLEAHPYLRPAENRAPGRLDDFPKPQTTDLREDVLDCLKRAEAVGLDVLVHDLTRPDVGFAVARVLAPGLRHFWRRLGPGRLYDTPVQLGWVDRVRLEEEMNPVSMFV